MTLEMVLAAFGTPTQVQDVTTGNPDVYTLRYGSPETGSVIELHQGVVPRATVARLLFRNTCTTCPIAVAASG